MTGPYLVHPMEPIYLDNNATTPLLPAVWEAMQPYWCERPGNPASSHRVGQEARQAVETAREQIAHLLDAHPDEVLFTSGATEANNLAVFGLAGEEPGLIMAGRIEHPCVVEPLRQLESRGWRISWLPVDARGIAQLPADCPLDELRLVSLMLANHETGAVQPVAECATLLAGAAPLHCDAAAAVGKIPVSFAQLGATALTISAHKFHGPKGIGALLLRRSARLRPLFWGGHQQQGKRPGTEPVPLVVGMVKALELAVAEMPQRTEKVLALRHTFLQILRAQAAPVVINGPDTDGVPHTLNVSFPGCRADALLMNLDLAGVACSTGSACSSGSLLPSPVVKAMGVGSEVLESAMRFSFSHLLRLEQVAEAANRISNKVNKLRQ